MSARTSNNSLMQQLNATNGLSLPGRISSKTWTFVEDETGDTGAHTLATITGLVSVRLVAFVGTTVVGAGTIEVGITGATATLLPQVADATDLVAGRIWHDATVDAQIEDVSVLGTKHITTQNLLLTIGTTDLTAGEITFVCFWSPLSEDANLTMNTPA